MQTTWVVLIPPALVLGLAVVTQRVLSALLVGIIASGLILTNFSVVKTIPFLAYRFWEQMYDASNLYTFGFLIILGMIIALMSAAGGTAAYGKLIRKILTNARSAQFSSMALSFLFMIDDFFSCLTVGCIMRPLADKFKIPRAKLAFLIDSLASPLIVIVPISTWVAMLLMQLEKAGISDQVTDKPIFFADPFMVYLQVIPFVFYSCITLVSVWFIIYYNISFGFMRKHELIAEQTGNLFGGRPAPKATMQDMPEDGSITDFIFPLTCLIGFSVAAFFYSGNSSIFGGPNNFFETLKHADIFFSFFFGSLVSLTLTSCQLIIRKKLRGPDMKKIASEGLELMLGSIQILLLAWTFSSILKNDLQTGQYIAQLLIGSLPAWLLPVMFFIASLLTSVATGSSWGTIAVMTPLAIPMLATFFDLAESASIASAPLLIPVLGGIFSGAAAGDHISPIGTTTVMAATSVQTYLEDHVWTQLPYGLPIVAGTIIAYGLAGLLIGYPLTVLLAAPMGAGIAVSLGGLLLLNRYAR